MIRAQNPNLQILEFAVERLGELTNEMVFLGGCATGLLMTDEVRFGSAAVPAWLSRKEHSRGNLIMLNSPVCYA